MAESVFIRGEGGSVFKMDLPLHEAIAERLTKGYLVRVNEDGSLYAEQPAKMPAKNAPKAAWVGWAVKAHGVAPDDAEAATLSDLVELYGSESSKSE